MSTPENAPKGLILVVEPEKHLREAMVDILEIFYYEMMSAENGIQALDVLRACHQLPDLIVADAKLPYMNGLELHDEVGKEPAWMYIPFLFLYGEYMERLSSDELGKLQRAGDCLRKPFHAEDFVATVEALVKWHRKIDE